MNPMHVRSSLLSITLALAGCTTAAPPVDAAIADSGLADASLGSPSIILAGGGSLVANAGDVLHLDVVLVSLSGTQTPLPAGAVVEWTAPPQVTALASGSMPLVSNLPAPGLHPTGFFLQNREHYTDAQLAGVLFVTSAGTVMGGITVDAHIVATNIDAHVSATIPVGAVPGGDAATGQSYFAANCASCHGPRGEGNTAPGLNHATGNVASDPQWNSALFASVTRADLDNFGVSEGPGMPLWLVTPAADGALLSTQHLVDVYAWLLTQD